MYLLLILKVVTIHLEKVKKIEKHRNLIIPQSRGYNCKLFIITFPSEIFPYVDKYSFKTQDDNTHNTLCFVLFT